MSDPNCNWDQKEQYENINPWEEDKKYHEQQNMSEYLKPYRKNKLDEPLCKYKLKKMTFLINKVNYLHFYILLKA